MNNDTVTRMRDIAVRKAIATDKIIEPARAAANAMTDAGMTRSAEPLLAALFEIDAIQDEATQLVQENPTEAIEALIAIMSGGRANG